MLSRGGADGHWVRHLIRICELSSTVPKTDAMQLTNSLQMIEKKENLRSSSLLEAHCAVTKVKNLTGIVEHK